MMSAKIGAQMTKESWPNVPLGRVINHCKEFIQINDLETYKRVRVQLHAQGIVLRDTVLGAEIKTKRQQLCHCGEFLVAEIDAKVGGFGIMPESLEGAIVSSHYFLFTLDESSLDRRFLDYFLRTRSFRDQVTAQGSTNYAAIRPEDVLSYEIPLPPLDEQRRIVARIEELAARIEEARELRRRAVEETETLAATTISNLYFEENCWTNFKNIVADKNGAVRSGPFGSQLHHDEFVESGVAAIGTRDVQVNRFILSSGWHITLDKFEKFKRYQVFPGDVLTTIVGASIGRFCVVPNEVPLAFTTKHVMALTLDCNIAEPAFVTYMLNFHARCRKSIFSQTEGSAQPSLNAAKVLKSNIPLPSLSEQRRILAYLDSLQSKLDALKRHQAETVAEIDALLPAVLERAFRGEL